MKNALLHTIHLIRLDKLRNRRIAGGGVSSTSCECAGPVSALSETHTWPRGTRATGRLTVEQRRLARSGHHRCGGVKLAGECISRLSDESWRADPSEMTNHGGPTPQNVTNRDEPTPQNVMNRGEPTPQLYLDLAVAARS